MSNMDSPYENNPSLPLVKFTKTESGRIIPYCEKHGAMLCFKHHIYRCDVCKTSIHMNSFYDLLKEMFRVDVE